MNLANPKVIVLIEEWIGCIGSRNINKKKRGRDIFDSLVLSGKPAHMDILMCWTAYREQFMYESDGAFHRLLCVATGDNPVHPNNEHDVGVEFASWMDWGRKKYGPDFEFSRVSEESGATR